MTPINNSDLTWLIVSDYNQDNGLGYPDELREDILNPDCNNEIWVPFPTFLSYEVGNRTGCIGGDEIFNEVGGGINGGVVGMRTEIGGFLQSRLGAAMTFGEGKIMTPINNSDLAWLIVSDYNQDNNIPGADDLREDVYNPEINDWTAEHIYFGIGVTNRGCPHLVNPVGGIPTGHMDTGGIVGAEIGQNVGQNSIAGSHVGDEMQGIYVGGRHYRDNVKH